MDLREIPSHLARRHPWEVARARFFARVLVEAGLEDVPRSVLDAGAGDGYTLKNILLRLPTGSEAVCFDAYYTDDDLARFATSPVPGVSHVREPPPRRFDVLLLLDVLEHVEDDVGFLSSLVAANLADRGTVLISVPTWPSLFTEHDRAMRHHRRYTPKSCRARVAAAGLEVVRGGGLFHALLPLRALSALREGVLRRLGRATVAPTDVGQWQRGPMLSQLVERALFADNALSRQLADVGLSLPGLSYWALCRARS